MTLERKTPLKRTGFLNRGKPLARSSLKPGKALDRGKGLKRGGPLKPRSDKRRAEGAERSVAVMSAFARDGWVLVRGQWVGGRCIPHEAGMPGRCFGHLTPHRLHKGSAGGGYTLDNVVSACSFHNDLVEDEPDLARACGMVL